MTRHRTCSECGWFSRKKLEGASLRSLRQQVLFAAGGTCWAGEKPKRIMPSNPRCDRFKEGPEHNLTPAEERERRLL